METTYDWAVQNLQSYPAVGLGYSFIDSGKVETFVNSKSGAVFGYDRGDHHLAFILSPEGEFQVICECTMKGMQSVYGRVLWETIPSDLAEELRRKGFS